MNRDAVNRDAVNRDAVDRGVTWWDVAVFFAGCGDERVAVCSALAVAGACRYSLLMC